jgi:hypothetical protein
VIYTSDEAFRPGGFTLALFGVTRVDFGLAAYLDKSPKMLTVSKGYRIAATTYSYRYFAFDLPIVYEKFKLSIRELTVESTGGSFMTVLVNFGGKPTTSRNIFNSETPVDGVSELRHEPCGARCAQSSHLALCS